MKRFPIWIAIAVMAVAMPLAAAEEPAGKAQESESASGEKKEGHLEVWKWANFLLLAAGLGYLIGKNAGPFFESRSSKIREGLAGAEQKRQEADARVAEVEARLAGLEGAITELREESERFAAAEKARLEDEAAAHLTRMEARATDEIAAAGKAARLELKRHAAQLAVELAEQKARARMTAETQNALVDGFVKDLDGPTRGATD
jgi:F-type H+-transporting ATPase subunit b